MTWSAGPTRIRTDVHVRETIWRKFMEKKLWLKEDPSVTAVVKTEHGGAVVALITNPAMRDNPEHPEVYLGFIDVGAWSEEEVVPVPACMGDTLWVAVVGEKDPTDVTFVTYDNEVALRVALATREDILGWFELPAPPSMFRVG
jgi:hypothetical protein